jgi:hypothetical protein
VLDRRGSVADQPFYGLHAIFLAQSLGLERDKHAFFLLKTSLMDHVLRTGLYHRDGKPWDFLCEDVVGTVSIIQAPVPAVS